MTEGKPAKTGLTGLSSAEALRRQQQYGPNQIKAVRKLIPPLLKEVATEPMFLLLIAACTIYLMLGQGREGIMTIIALLIVAAISIFQGIRSSRALKALQDLSEPRVKVIRDSTEMVIASILLVPGDVMQLEEGEKVPADAVILQSNDLLINESVITGESLPVEKKEKEKVYQGTVIQGGRCYAEVTATGNRTELGMIGKSIEQYAPPKTNLQTTISRYVKILAIFGLAGFVLIWIFNYFQSGDVLFSLLAGLTLIMAAIPEEIPVAFSSFMALGAYRMSKLGIISRHPVVIENLGAVSVICLDKTGTITENRMEVRSLFDFTTGEESPVKDSEVFRYAVMASEENPYDEMEKAILKASHPFGKAPSQPLLFEYPLQGHPPMMTHVFGNKGNYVAAAKGAPERIMQVCKLTEPEIQRLSNLVIAKASAGHRILAVAGCAFAGEVPASQSDFPWEFKGLVFLYDPPKKGIEKVFGQISEAGISVKLITGDYAQTAQNIAAQVGIATGNKHVEGRTVMNQSMDELRKTVTEYVLFARMFPEAKLRVIEALKHNGEIVAMTGDGVNDAPALKASHIGIAMGKYGTQIARQASDIILTDDDMGKVISAIRHGRKIFANLKKAVRYIISIHIPIILTASLPLLFGWKYPNIFTPIHVIFLELIMGPTCSIFFENEPEAPGLMRKTPRKRNIGLFSPAELRVSVLQGLVITLATLGLLFHYSSYHSLEEARAMVFTTLLISNIILTFTNRSFSEPLYRTISYKNNLTPLVLSASLAFLLLIHAVPEVRSLFGMATLTTEEIIICSSIGFAAVIWIEFFKIFAKKRNSQSSFPS